MLPLRRRLGRRRGRSLKRRRGRHRRRRKNRCGTSSPRRGGLRPWLRGTALRPFRSARCSNRLSTGSSVGRKSPLDDSGLHDGAGAIHARHDVHVNGAAFGGGAGARGVADGIALGMLDPEILGGAHQAFGHIVADAARERVVAGGADFVVGADDHAADLGIRILTAGGEDLADIKVIPVPGGDLAHNIQLHFSVLSGKLKGFPQSETSCSYGCCITITVLMGRRRLPTSADSSRARSTRMLSSAIRGWPIRRRSCSIRRCSTATKTPLWTSNTPATPS